MAITLSTAARNAACNAVVDLVDGGSGPGLLRIRDSSTLLVEFTLGDPAFGDAATGVATAKGGDDTNPISSGNPIVANAVAAGEADNYQVLDSDENVIWSGTVTASGGGGDITLDNVNIANGQEVRLTAWTHTAPA